MRARCSHRVVRQSAGNSESLTSSSSAGKPQILRNAGTAAARSWTGRQVGATIHRVRCPSRSPRSVVAPNHARPARSSLDWRRMAVTLGTAALSVGVVAQRRRVILGLRLPAALVGGSVQVAVLGGKPLSRTYPVTGPDVRIVVPRPKYSRRLRIEPILPALRLRASTSDSGR